MAIKYSDYKPFEDTLYKITDDPWRIKAHYLAARTDEVRQEIIDKVNSGELKNMDEVAMITRKMSPLYKAGLI